MLPPKAPARRGGGRLRWLLTMSTAVALALVVTRQPSGSGGRRGRDLVEDALPHSRAGGASHGPGGSQGVSAAAGDGAAINLAQQAAAAAETAARAAQAAQQQQLQPERPELSWRAACVARATTMPSPVHGWVTKAGALPMRLLDGPQTLARHRAYFNWRDSGNLTLLTQQVLLDGKPARIGRTPPLFPYCRALVSHRYRTLYLKAPKTGSTSLLTLLGTCTGAPTDKATCFEPLKPMASQEQYEALYRDYFVFAVVRNPWTRAVSSYRMLLRYMLRPCQPFLGGWSRECLDLNRLGRLHHSHPAQCTKHRQQGEGFAMHHLIPQAPCLVPEGGAGWAADYVVRMEHLQGDMREVLQQMDARRRGGAPPLDVDSMLGRLTNVNKVHVRCKAGPAGASADGGVAASGVAADGGVTASGVAAGASSRRRSLSQAAADSTAGAAAASGAGAAAAAQPRPHATGGHGKPDWLEAPESYCDDAQYYLGPHSQCFDALRHYYAQDVALFGLPRCDGDGGDEAAAAVGTAAAAA